MSESRKGDREISGALAESRRLFVSVGLFSVFVNALMLTGPLFMLQVYDRVLASRSEATLVTLIGIVAFLFLMMGVLDHARGRVLARAGARLQARLDSRVLRAILTRAIAPAERSRPATGVRDLEAIQRFFAGSGPFAFFDAPWTPVFLCALFMFHWMLGALAVFSGVLLLLIALLNQARTARLQREVSEAHNRSQHFVEEMRAGSETVHGLGMQDAVIARSGEYRDELLERSLAASDRSGFFHVTSKTLRLFLQSMMLGLGAWLAIHGQVSFGVMIAASILLGRALAPIDQAVAQWPQLQRVLAARRSLAALLEETPPEQHRTELPQPRAILEAQALTVAAPGAKAPAVRGASFRLEPGQAVGIAGPSASGKSTLARALAGVWRPIGGTVRLDGAALDQYGRTLGQHIGYLPQEVVLFEGTVAENIARFSPAARDEDAVEAAKRTGAHEMILRLPGGYDFQVSAGFQLPEPLVGPLSAGASTVPQGLGADFDDPVSVVKSGPVRRPRDLEQQRAVRVQLRVLVAARQVPEPRRHQTVRRHPGAPPRRRVVAARLQQRSLDPVQSRPDRRVVGPKHLAVDAVPAHVAANGSGEAAVRAHAAHSAPAPAPAPLPMEPDLEEATVRGFVVKSAAGTLASAADQITARMDYLRQTRQHLQNALDNSDTLADLPDGIDLDEEMAALTDISASIRQEAAGIAGLAKRLDSVAGLPNSEVRRSMTDVNACIEEAVEACGPKAAQVISKRLGDIPEILASRAELRLLLKKIVENSVRAVDELDGREGVVRIDTARKGDEIVITVIDNGDGIAAEKRMNIFRPFYTSHEDAMGIGLTLAGHLAKKYEGVIKINSLPGQGTVAQITLPAGVPNP